MKATILAIDPTGDVLLFTFLVVLAAALATVVWWLLRRPAARGPQYQGAGSVSRAATSVAALAVALPIVAYAYARSWRHFYGPDLADGRLGARFSFPEHTERTGAVDLLRVSTRSALRKSGTTYRLALRTADGRLFTSALVGRRELEPALARLERTRAVHGRPGAP